MAGWSHEKRVNFERAFFAFLDNAYVNSKDAIEPICLGKALYRGQRQVITQILDALEEDIHKIYILKSRQLGITTIIRALSIFYIGVHKGLKGALVFDTAPNREEARAELVTMIRDLPDRLKFPRIKGAGEGNRDGVTLQNDSKILFKNAGVKKSRSSGTLGRSVGLAFAHMCMAPDTPVIVADGRIKRIEDVRVGDQIITHTGATANVIANSARLNFSPMIKITSWLGQPIVCTPEHRIPTVRGTVFAADIRQDDIVLMPIRKITKQQFSTQLPAPLSGQKGRLAVGTLADFPLDEETGFALGYYLAEGSICYQRRDARYYDYPSGITFSRHRNEKTYADRAIAALRPYTTGTRGTLHAKNSLTTTETIYGAALARWVEQIFGARDAKIIPDTVFTWGEDFCRGLLAGLLCGDGSKTVCHTQKYPVNSVRISTTRASIAMQVRDIAAALGYGWAGWAEQQAGQRYGRNCKHIWTVMWNGRCAAALRALMGLTPIASRGHTFSEKFIVYPGYIGLKIRKLERVGATSSVNDLAVDHPDHTFRTPSFSVSNSELCSYDNDEGLAAFEESLSDSNPIRLYIYESTARGPNSWKDMWDQARKDPAHCCCIFLGWWSKDSQRIERNDPDFERYGKFPPTEAERKKIHDVLVKYGVEITPEQLAWYRRKIDPTAESEGDLDPEFEASSVKLQEQPWTEEESWQITGSVFFPSEALTDISNRTISNKFQPYFFMPGQDFIDMKIYKSTNLRQTELRVWEEPEPDAFYIVGADPAYGTSEYNDHSAIEIYRAYADGLDQVAEYSSPLVTTRQLAWVLGALLGWYGTPTGATVKYALELNGPGYAVFNALKELRTIIESGIQAREMQERGLFDIFRNVRTYIYSRPDSMGNGSSYHLKSTQDLKRMYLERFRDHVTNYTTRLRSKDLIEEMKYMARDGDSISAPSSKRDDRVMASAFADHCWGDAGVKRQLMLMGRTRDAEAARQRVSITDQVTMFQRNQLNMFFERKRRVRVEAHKMAVKQAWRYR